MNSIVSQNDQPIKPFLTEEGIELYATDSECGMSISGLARFCGVSQSTMSDLISRLTHRQNVPEILQELMGQELVAIGCFENNAKVYKSELCAVVCEYYAYESKAANETAKYSYRKFAKLGIDSWIRQVTGHEEKPKLTPLEAAMLLIEKLESKLEIERDSKASMAKFVNGPQGLKEIYEGWDEDSELLALPSGTEQDGRIWYTARQYLEIMQEESPDMKDPVQKRQYYKFTGLIAHFYRVYNLGEQMQISFNGRTPVNVYCTHDFPLLATAWKQAEQEMRDEKAKTIAAKYKRV
jgi:hypothetical protein